MLTYEQALARVSEAVPPPRRVHVALERALGLVLAERIAAPLDLPRFDNSAVDGYAIRPLGAGPASSAHGHRISLPVIGCSSAGSPFRGALRPGQAARILTGAVVPRGTESIMMQEHVTQQDDHVAFERWPDAGRHIRRRGEDMRRGEQIFTAGTHLRPQHIGLLAAMGRARVHVYRPPTVAILTTGDELRRPGARLQPGQIYESNGALLRALLQREGAVAKSLGLARDRMQPLIAGIRRGLRCDALLICGGVSVGDKDLVRAAADACGVREIFWRVNIKPGMPLFFGTRGRTLVFGLPGNPVSVFVNFEEFVKPAVRQLMGRAWQDAYTAPAVLAGDLAVSPTRRTHFLRIRYSAQDPRVAESLNGQGSHQLRSLVEADGWIRVRAEEGPWPAGSRVLVKPESRW